MTELEELQKQKEYLELKIYILELEKKAVELENEISRLRRNLYPYAPVEPVGPWSPLIPTPPWGPTAPVNPWEPTWIKSTSDITYFDEESFRKAVKELREQVQEVQREDPTENKG